MAITTTANPEDNLDYFTDGEFDYAQVARFFDHLHATFADRSINGGDIDRLQASMIVGRNSLLVRLDRREQSMKQRSEFVIEGENESGAERRRVFPMLPLPGEKLGPATARWLADIQAALLQVATELVLPVNIVPIPPVLLNTEAPEEVLPDSYVAVGP